MTAFAGAACGAALIANLVAVLVWAAGAWLLGRRLGRVNIIDTLWGPGFGLVAVVTLVTAGVTSAGDGARQAVLAVLVLAWGIRLGWHVGRRSAGRGEDPRYAALLRQHGGQSGQHGGQSGQHGGQHGQHGGQHGQHGGQSGQHGGQHGGHSTRAAWTFVYVPQLMTLYVVSLPVQVGMFTGPPIGAVGWLGVALAVTGIAFESIGDAQLSRFKADPANHGRLIDVGLWRYTRHPNYFGDACLWAGLYLVAAEHWPGMLTIVSPVLMTCLLAFGTGKRLLERSMAERPGYPEYMRRTSGFVPLPPRKHAS